MQLPVPLQTLQFLLSAVMGIALGVHYDILRVLRGSRKWLTQLLDLWFCLTTLLLLLLFALYAGQGQFRLFFFLGTGIGAMLWFLTLSRPFRFVLGKFFHFLLLPARLLWQGTKKILKKITKMLKNLFSYAEKWSMIRKDKKQSVQNKQKQKGGRRNAVSEVIAVREAGRSGYGRLRDRDPGVPAGTDPGSTGRQRKKGKADQHS
jgi:spore cortex biosynthesis protein YabQ